jgi:hypothetical protein
VALTGHHFHYHSIQSLPCGLNRPLTATTFTFIASRVSLVAITGHGWPPLSLETWANIICTLFLKKWSMDGKIFEEKLFLLKNVSSNFSQNISSKSLPHSWSMMHGCLYHSLIHDRWCIVCEEISLRHVRESKWISFLQTFSNRRSIYVWNVCWRCRLLKTTYRLEMLARRRWGRRKRHNRHRPRCCLPTSCHSCKNKQENDFKGILFQAPHKVVTWQQFGQSRLDFCLQICL